MTAAIWLIVIVGILAILQSKFFSKVAFRHLHYERKLTKHAVFEGESLELQEVIANRKLTPLPWLRVESKLSPWLRFRSQENLEIMDDRFHRSVFYLRPYSRITRRYNVKCIRRGYYDLSITTLTAGRPVRPEFRQPGGPFRCQAVRLSQPLGRGCAAGRGPSLAGRCVRSPLDLPGSHFNQRHSGLSDRRQPQGYPLARFRPNRAPSR